MDGTNLQEANELHYTLHGYPTNFVFLSSHLTSSPTGIQSV